MLITIFLEGLLSFFSPCVLPLLPLYMGYLSGGTQSKDEKGNTIYNRKVVLLNTIFFVLGISVAFILLGLTVSSVIGILADHKLWIYFIGGIFILIMGLFQVGVINPKLLNKEFRLFKIPTTLVNSPILAFGLGLFFSFAWTPCVGPILSSVLMLVGTADTFVSGIFYILCYTLGFIIPFLIVGIFTTSILNWLKEKMFIVKYTKIIGGIILILVACYLLFASVPTIFNITQVEEAPIVKKEDVKVENSNEVKEEKPTVFTFDFKDTNGTVHNLSNYKDKLIVLNFWTSWCGPCVMEIPDLNRIYADYGSNTDKIVFLGVGNPNAELTFGVQGNGLALLNKGIIDNNIQYPVIVDDFEYLTKTFNINSFPTTFIIKNETVVDVLIGAQTYDVFKKTIDKNLSK
jgi:cytochrome c-type biogenesis protein